MKGGHDRLEHPWPGGQRLCVPGHKVNLTMNFCCQVRREARRGEWRLHTPAGGSTIVLDTFVRREWKTTKNEGRA